jgi:hypothetical protein
LGTAPRLPTNWRHSCLPDEDGNDYGQPVAAVSFVRGRSRALSGGFCDAVGSIISRISGTQRGNLCRRPCRALPQCRAVSYCTPVVAANWRTDSPRTPRRKRKATLFMVRPITEARTPRSSNHPVNGKIVLCTDSF